MSNPARLAVAVGVGRLARCSCHSAGFVSAEQLAVLVGDSIDSLPLPDELN